jgi:hypothetical protein
LDTAHDDICKRRSFGVVHPLCRSCLCTGGRAGAKSDAAGGIRVRVGVPYVARGPGAIADSWFTEVRLPDGRYRGFTALGSTFAIDGQEPYSMGGNAATVLKRALRAVLASPDRAARAGQLEQLQAGRAVRLSDDGG